MERGLYIHVPFCIKKCNYCDFNSFKFTKEDKENYIESLIKEINIYSKKLKENYFSTFFIGGGTPTVLSESELKSIFENIYSGFNIKKDAEITIEANPGTLTKEKLKTLYDLGVNRLSVGLQASQQEHLDFLGRIHSYEEFEKNFNDAKDIGFKNINVDLMFSLPNQSFNDWKETLEKVVNLNPTHISAYSLIIEDETVFGNMHKKGELNILDEEIELRMYHYTKDYLKNKGYNQYEISNFSKSGYECKHNILYWKCKEYLGLGPGAHSYIEGVRYSNYCSLEKYFKRLNNDDLPIECSQKLEKKDKLEEKIFMGLRMKEGIYFKEFEEYFKIDFMKEYKDVIEKLKNEGLINFTKDRLYLTDKGIDISNKVFVEFLKD
ncbi:radical SAM family heme chaperone HemW [Tepidibacter formicigenes]|uniref:Heme chaperone HemW n=1 Tax=Tepidibacter formicigenes DSM 15518 TaxID=1123349 RepID=A0A1M6LXA3_9FIRM|nr:radical SAM family heme chaperone HemW [Tepidibacter formicigenes]SHJ75781.1 oxygen-independent coproporphyrinogen-3 oxidase [Tepidibacter formicigenes DSM 15518]